jgi:hypothetical protein
MTRLFVPLFCLAALLPAAIAQTEQKPDFSGQWRMNDQKSDFGKFPMPTSITRTIVQRGVDLSVDTVERGSNGEQTAHAIYRTDGVDTTNHFNTGEGMSHAFWDGETLVIRTSMKTKNGVEVVMEERWDLSPDKNNLTTHSHIETSKGAADLKLVCDRIR